MVATRRRKKAREFRTVTRRFRSKDGMVKVGDEVEVTHWRNTAALVSSGYLSDEYRTED